MRLILTAIAGPHSGQVFAFDGHETFLVGRSPKAHFRLQPGESKDLYISRIHFMVEVNPPLCRVHDMNSRNGTLVNGVRIASADLHHGDKIKAGHTLLRVSLEEPDDGVTNDWSGLLRAATVPLAEQPGAASEEVSCLECNAPRPGPSDPLCPRCRRGTSIPAQTIPGYVLLRELGRGAMGVVHLALCKADRSLVAVKTIVPLGAVRPNQVERFLREANILRQLNHPHIVSFREMGAAAEQFFFVMDYIRGMDAAQLLKTKGPLPMRMAVRLVNQLLLALEYAHTHGFVHRDIKPANLLIDASAARKTVKVADFGLARVYQASQLSGLTLQNDLGGTVGFMPPEQISNYREVCPAADQYSAAATLYKLLTGRFVYDLPPQLHARLAMILSEKSVPIRDRRADLPARLAAVIHQALARDPARRFTDVRQFRRALRPFAR
ncbi:MAG TPA: FHA domain-containing serine/threonine-protein kinase [Gemmataceae bacterium]|nr:FHA domain-containing serine/threonine-protein kinase [Gemmataceae bacterium]